MSATSTIEWTDATWNPVRGCTKISPGCKHCYAETFAERFRGVPGHPYEQGATSLNHIWWGTSVEDRKFGVPRIRSLRNSPAAVRFLSIEPLLEDVGEIELADIHWVIVGGESGAGARP
ncbi:MAG: DUF5131 family protein, partial [candidate division Zixibacteria bacterium]|nr:DUF5131 family protein [candidate division Zixibacteria bacterium]